LKVINKALAAAQTKTHAASRCITIPKGELDVGNSGPLIVEYQFDTLSGSLFDHLSEYGAATAMLQRIAR
jgi:hypothetical protein